MRRDVTARLDLSVAEPALLAFQVAVAGPATEQLGFFLDGWSVAADEVTGPDGGRTHVLWCPPGRLAVEYTAGVDGTWLPPAPATTQDRLAALRPSRYCPSDRLLGIATTEFGAHEGAPARIDAVAAWVRARLRYVIGSSRGTDDAVDSLLLGEGVCRDHAHLVIALLRALDVPARMVAVYAPGLYPMDFHAVAEAWDGERWRVVDSTGLAPRAAMLRIATGRDAADTAFLTSHHGIVELVSMQVTATADLLPTEQPDETVVLG